MWNLRLGELGLSSHHLQLGAGSQCSWGSQPCACGHEAGGEQGSTVVKLKPSCLQEAWKESPPLQSMFILSASLRAAAGALIWCMEQEPCCTCHNPVMSPVITALPKVAPAVPEGKGQQAMGSKPWKLIQRGERMWAVKGKKNAIHKPNQRGEFSYYQKPVILELLIFIFFFAYSR